MTNPSLESVTLLIQRWGNGDQQALDKLVTFAYTELNRKAHQLLQQERPGHTLQTADLVHEAYLRLLELSNIQWQGQKHFFAVVAGVMRRILVDRARARNAYKRGGDWQRTAIDENQLSEHSQPTNVDLLALDEALKTLIKQGRFTGSGGRTSLFRRNYDRGDC